MTPEQISLLEFKRKFVLENLERIKKGHDRVMSHSESVKKWVITIWFGSIALSLKEKWPSADTFSLLMLTVLMFYFLDTYFISLAKEYSERIDKIERWIMSATNEKILSLESALHDIGPTFSFKKRILFYLISLGNRYVIIFYLFLGIFSVVVTNLKINIG